MAKADFLKECMSDFPNVPLDAFQKSYCVMCANRECQRSGLNNSMFDTRVRNWREILFTAVPRASEDDPKYDNIRARKFLPLTENPPIEVQERPRVELRSRAEIAMGINPDLPRRPTEDDDVISTPTQDPELTEVMEDSEPVPPPGGGLPPRPIAKPVPVENTPFSQGAMLPGGPPPAGKVEAPGSSFVFDDEEE